MMAGRSRACGAYRPAHHPLGWTVLEQSPGLRGCFELFSISYVFAKVCNFFAAKSGVIDRFSSRLGFFRLTLLWVAVFTVVALASAKALVGIFFATLFLLMALQFFTTVSKDPVVFSWETKTSGEAEFHAAMRRFFPPVLAFVLVLGVANSISKMWNLS